MVCKYLGNLDIADSMKYGYVHLFQTKINANSTDQVGKEKKYLASGGKGSYQFVRDATILPPFAISFCRTLTALIHIAKDVGSHFQGK